MFCVKCGKLIEDGLELCDDCIFEEINKEASNETPRNINEKTIEHTDEKTNEGASIGWIYVVAFFIPLYGVILASGLLAKNENSNAKNVVIVSVISMILNIIMVVILYLIL